jgi:hypothetical protein
VEKFAQVRRRVFARSAPAPPRESRRIPPISKESSFVGI